MHCSANTDMNGENIRHLLRPLRHWQDHPVHRTSRLLIGDDEHGWDDNGAFNFEGGCQGSSTWIRNPSRTSTTPSKRNALLEKRPWTRTAKIDFADKSVTENTRVLLPD